jgi:clan AA aspartic protease
MISGKVSADGDAVIRLLVQGPSGLSEEVEAVIDTGFTDFLTLPFEAVARLGLPLQHLAQVMYSDGSVHDIPIYEATVTWDDKALLVPIQAEVAMPLVVMKMMHGYNLSVDVVADGIVQLTKLPS